MKIASILKVTITKGMGRVNWLPGGRGTLSYMVLNAHVLCD